MPPDASISTLVAVGIVYGRRHCTKKAFFGLPDFAFENRLHREINYIVDDLGAFLDRMKHEGVEIEPKRQDESYGRFAWIYDSGGNKIEHWQPLAGQK